MNKKQYTYMVRNELKRLNKTIDAKIVVGYPYDHDAKRHKMLLRNLSRINKKSRNTRTWSDFFKSSRAIMHLALF